jgi:hypothetical protein
MAASQGGAADVRAFTVRLRPDIHRALRGESLDTRQSAQDIIADMLAARYHLPPVVAAEPGQDNGQAPPAQRDLPTG